MPEISPTEKFRSFRESHAWPQVVDNRKLELFEDQDNGILLYLIGQSHDLWFICGPSSIFPSALMEILSIILLIVFFPIGSFLYQCACLSEACKVYILGGSFVWSLKQCLAVGMRLAEVNFKRSHWIKCS